MKTYLNCSVLRVMVVVLLFISSITAANSTSALAKHKQRKQQVSSGDSGKLQYQGQLRTYYLHVPKSYKPDRPMSLVLVFHGSGGSGRAIAQVSRFNQLADKKGFIVAYPDGINHHWHYGNTSSQTDDVSFVAALIAHLKQLKNIDSQKIYATGFSSGGILTQDLACKLSNQIAAFASVAGTLATQTLPNCQPQHPVSILMINGTGDRAVPYYKGIERELVSVPKTIEFWQQHNNCASNPKVELLPKTTRYRETQQAKISRYSGCRSGSEVMLVSVQRGGHRWPGGASHNSGKYQGVNSEINASTIISNFFQRHALDGKTTAESFDRSSS